MSSFLTMSSNADLLAAGQENITMFVIAQVSGIDRAKLDPAFFDFDYLGINDTEVRVTFTGRAYAKDGRRGIWTGSRQVTLTRANLSQGANDPIMNVAYVSGMTMEHILRALYVTYNFNVDSSELLLKMGDTYQPFSRAYKPLVGTLEMKFVQNQCRFIPSTSEFKVVLDNNGRLDINDYLTVINAGSVLGEL